MELCGTPIFKSEVEEYELALEMQDRMARDREKI